MVVINSWEHSQQGLGVPPSTPESSERHLLARWQSGGNVFETPRQRRTLPKVRTGAAAQPLSGWLPPAPAWVTGGLEMPLGGSTLTATSTARHFPW